MGSVAVRGHQRGCRSADGAAVGGSFGQVASAAVGFAWPGYSLSARSLPRLATSGRPVWSGGLGTLGPPAPVGAAGLRSDQTPEGRDQWARQPLRWPSPTTTPRAVSYAAS